MMQYSGFLWDSSQAGTCSRVFARCRINLLYRYRESGSRDLSDPAQNGMYIGQPSGRTLGIYSSHLKFDMYILLIYKLFLLQACVKVTKIICQLNAVQLTGLR